MKKEECLDIIYKMIADGIITQDDAAKYFPELESEDRIISCIRICILASDKQRFINFNTNVKECIDYIENKNKPNPYSGVSFDYNGHTWGMCARDNGVEILVDGKLKERVFLDKPLGKSALETINEEKVDNANKVEPQFKVKDWIVNDTSKDVFLIKSINAGYYTLENINGKVYTCCLPPIEDNNHRWSIRDARAGDVLVSYNNNPFIFNGEFDSLSVGGYCGIDIRDNFVVIKDIKECNWTSNKDIKPATKEQRHLLFQKLNENGYVWNPVKKELNKLK